MQPQQQGGSNLLNTIREGIPPIHKEGLRFVAIFAAITILFYYFELRSLGAIMIALTVWCYFFFRDPIRVVPQEEGLVVSPADGLIQMIVQAVPPAELEMGDEELTRISIFLNVFNVHINRVPIAGKITALYYHPGKFLNAAMDKASEENERQLAKVTTADGKEVGFIQIAGLIARRILCFLNEDQEVATGERYGLIRFGSRTDIFLPKGIEPLVVAGQIAVGGETVLADLKGKQKKRTGASV